MSKAIKDEGSYSAQSIDCKQGSEHISGWLHLHSHLDLVPQHYYYTIFAEFFSKYIRNERHACSQVRQLLSPQGLEHSISHRKSQRCHQEFCLHFWQRNLHGDKEDVLFRGHNHSKDDHNLRKKHSTTMIISCKQLCYKYSISLWWELDKNGTFSCFFPSHIKHKFFQHDTVQLCNLHRNFFHIHCNGLG